MRVILAGMAALASVLTGVAQAPPPAQSGSGRISGRVITPYAEFVQDATVTLTRIGPTGLLLDQRAVRSGANGSFTLEQLPAGQYSLSATKPGFTSREPVAASRINQPDQSISGTPAQTVRFRAGPVLALEERHEVVGVEITLYRAASIAGRIIQPDGTPAANAVVIAGQRRTASSPPQLLMESRTFAEWDGRYEITGLPPGEYFVSAQAAESSRSTLYPGVPDTESGDIVTVLEGISAEGIDIWLTPAQRFNVSGRVFWPAGIAVEGISIDYGDPAGARSAVWYVADPGGLFTLTGLPPGPLVMLARADTDQGPLFGIASTEVTVDRVEDVRIVMDRPGTVEGRVVFEGGVPPSAQAATITLVQKLFKVSAVFPVSETTVEATGRFRLRNALGVYEFELRGLPAGFTIRRVSRGGLPLPGNRIRVTGGETVGDIEVSVAR